MDGYALLASTCKGVASELQKPDLVNIYQRQAYKTRGMKIKSLSLTLCVQISWNRSISYLFKSLITRQEIFSYTFFF